MTAAKFKWKVDEAPTGQYRSFQYRGWPCAIYKNDHQDLCGDIQCKDDYTPARAKNGQHAPLTVRICDHRVKPYKWCTLEGRHATLVEAKAALAAYVASHPSVMPAEFHPNPIHA